MDIGTDSPPVILGVWGGWGDRDGVLSLLTPGDKLWGPTRYDGSGVKGTTWTEPSIQTPQEATKTGNGPKLPLLGTHVGVEELLGLPGPAEKGNELVAPPAQGA